MSEAQEQAATIEWARLMSKKYEPLRWLYHTPNGGSRNKLEAARLKQQGTRPGIPDLFLPYPTGTKAGLWIEMKYGKNKLTAHQKECLEYLDSVGYATAVCYSAKEAIAVIEKYLNTT